MIIGSVVGIFEEIIPLVPIIIALSYSLGWDSLTGIGMSVLATGFGFASDIANPFTVGLAQKLSGLPIRIDRYRKINKGSSLVRIDYFIQNQLNGKRRPLRISNKG